MVRQLALTRPARRLSRANRSRRPGPFLVHFNDLESGGTSAGLLAVVNQTVDWIRLPPKVSGPNPRYNKISNYSQDRPDRHRGGGSSRFVDASGRLPPAPRARRK